MGASHAADELSAVLQRWYLPQPGIHRTFPRGIALDHWLARWHLEEYVRLGRLETGPRMYQDMANVWKTTVEPAIDRRDSKSWVGDCECGRAMRAWTNPDHHAYNSSFLCVCGKIHDITQSRSELQELGTEQLVSARDAEALGEIYGATIKPGTIRQWRNRGRLECARCVKDVSVCTEHIFRFGDVLELHKGKTDSGS